MRAMAMAAHLCMSLLSRRQRDAIRALVKSGAGIDLLEQDRYDAVTIAAVADDEETLRVLLALAPAPNR